MSFSREQQIIEELAERLVHDLISLSGVPLKFNANKQDAAPAPATAREYPTHAPAFQEARPSPAPPDEKPGQKLDAAHTQPSPTPADPAPRAGATRKTTTDLNTVSIRENGVETTLRHDPINNRTVFSAFVLKTPEVSTGVHTDPNSFHAALKKICAVAIHHRQDITPSSITPADKSLAANLRWVVRQSPGTGRTVKVKDTPHASYSFRNLPNGKTLYIADMKGDRRLQIRDSNPVNLVNHVLSYLERISPGMKQSQTNTQRARFRITP
jgi:hypothetical protein